MSRQRGNPSQGVFDENFQDKLRRYRDTKGAKKKKNLGFISWHCKNEEPHLENYAKHISSSLNDWMTHALLCWFFFSLQVTWAVARTSDGNHLSLYNDKPECREVKFCSASISWAHTSTLHDAASAKNYKYCNSQWITAWQPRTTKNSKAK